ncbi:MAG: nicotinate phosphoribosyltransferase, partial [Pseudomonadota bacterium]
MTKSPEKHDTNLSYDVATWSDSYFLRTKQIIVHFGDADVTYAIFMRRPVICAIRLAVDWLHAQQEARRAKFRIEILHKEGSWVGAGMPLLYVHGPFSQLVDLETQLLQRIGPACVAAYNAFQMCAELPQTQFMAMDARHCAGEVMSDFMSYAASIGSQRAQTRLQAEGFIGCATKAGAKYFGSDKGLGTMPHALVGYANSTLRAAEMFHQCFPDEPLTVLVDYFGQEITDSLMVCQSFPQMAANGMLRVRLDTIGGRYCQFL